jgi:peptidoglycan/xylan/chitin deacetylase (PgdA/CDA1 family)
VPSRRRALRSWAVDVAASRPVDALLGFGVRILDRLDRGRPGLLAVLTYHRVDEPEARPDLDPGLISATPAVFARQMAVLVRRHRVVSLDDLLLAMRGGRMVPPRAVMVTFDDAYQDFAEHAWPVLRRLGLPVTLFVPTGFAADPSRAFWWDRLHAALSAVDPAATPAIGTPVGRLSLTGRAERRAAFGLLVAHCKARPHDEALALVDELTRSLGAPPPRPAVLGWGDLRALAADGVTVAAHTVEHPLLTRIGGDRLARELTGALTDIERELGEPPPAVVAYPSGACNSAVVTAARAAGYALGFTTRRGLIDVARADPLRLRRINVGARASTSLIEAQLVSWAARIPGVTSDG